MLAIIENLINFIRVHGVGLMTSLLLIFIAGSHILEERVKGFRRFVNLEWFKTGREDFPVSRLESVVKDQILLFLTITILSLTGVISALFILVAVGFVAADLVQHSVFSIARRRYTPGIATSALYLLYVVYFAVTELSALSRAFGNGWTLGFLALGASALLLNYTLVSRRARKVQPVATRTEAIAQG